MILHCKNAEMTILHCKNAEMTIIFSFLHFYSVKSYNFCYFLFLIFFLNLAVFYVRGNKKKSIIIFSSPEPKAHR